MRRRVRLSGVRLALLAGAAILAVLFAIALSDSRLKLAGSAEVLLVGVAARVAPGERACLLNTRLPADTGNLGLRAGSGGRPGPPLAAEVLRGPQVLHRGAIPGGWRDGGVAIPVAGIEAPLEGVDVCVINTGTTPVTLDGDPVAPPGAQIAVAPLRSERESWWAVAPRVAERMGYGKSEWLGSWTFWAVGLLVLAAWAAGVRAVLSAERV